MTKKKYIKAFLIIIFLLSPIIIPMMITHMSFNMKTIDVKGFNGICYDQNIQGQILDRNISVQFNNSLHLLENISQLPKSNVDELVYSEDVIVEFYHKICFFETFYWDMRSKKYYTADNYEEILSNLVTIFVDNKDYFDNQMEKDGYEVQSE